MTETFTLSETELFEWSAGANAGAVHAQIFPTLTAEQAANYPARSPWFRRGYLAGFLRERREAPERAAEEQRRKEEEECERLLALETVA